MNILDVYKTKPIDEFNYTLENISYNEDSPYTSQIIIHAIEDALSKGKVE